MSKFELGDKVVVTNTKHPDQRRFIGQSGTVIVIHRNPPNGEDIYLVKFNNLEESPSEFFFEHKLELFDREIKLKIHRRKR